MIPLVSPDKGRKVKILIIVVNPTNPFVDNGNNYLGPLVAKTSGFVGSINCNVCVNIILLLIYLMLVKKLDTID